MCYFAMIVNWSQGVIQLYRENLAACQSCFLLMTFSLGLMLT